MSNTIMTTARKSVLLRLSDAQKSQVDKLAEITNRSRHWHAQTAMSEYLAKEQELTDALDRAWQDYEAGRVVPNEVAFARFRDTIAKAEKAEKKS
jgi:predicted transcriptional regulator